jgi:uncharacterized repeat protein (TIGR04076 family)
MVMVVRAFGQPCPAAYQPGDRFSLDEWWPEGSFVCERAFEALQPAVATFEDRVDRTTYPPCRVTASCDCPISRSEVVFALYSGSPHRGDQEVAR